jgi:hypothetical protein
MTAKQIRELAASVGLDVECESPGDGFTRYTFGHRRASDGAFFDIAHVCGAGEARIYLQGFSHGMSEGRK